MVSLWTSSLILLINICPVTVPVTVGIVCTASCALRFMHFYVIKLSGILSQAAAP